MKTLHVAILAATILTINGDYDFRYDYEFHELAQGWFKFHKTPTEWWLAETRCHFEGGVLASPLDENIMNVLFYIANSTEYGVHLGVHNRMSTALYTSIEGVPLSDMPARYTFPDDYATDKYCMRMYRKDIIPGNCSDLLPYICYKSKTAEFKQTVCGTEDASYILSQKTGHCYKFHNVAATWPVAFLTCDAEGGHLAIINSADEANVLKDLCYKYPRGIIVGNGYKDGAHIGFLDWYQNGSWRTIHGEGLHEAGYSSWGSGEPNNQIYKGQRQYCGSMFRSGLLDDTYCDLPLAFICEKDPNSLRRKRIPSSLQ